MVRRLASAYDTVLGEAMRSEGLTPQRWGVLLRLHFEEQQGRPGVRPTELSRAQQVTKNTISAHLNALEEDGLIVRTLDPADRRQVTVGLTDQARGLIRESAPRHLGLLNTLAAGLEQGERRRLLALLHQLHASILCNAAGGAHADACGDKDEGDEL